MEKSVFKVESGIQLLARISKRQSIENVYPVLLQSGPKPGEVIEIFSDNNITNLLIDMTCKILLPNCFSDVKFGVMLFNCNGQFDYSVLLSRMHQIICNHVNNLHNNYKYKESINELLKKALSHLFVVEIYDCIQFYSTIYNLENILLENNSISLVIFHTITEFYWEEQGFKIMRMDTYLKKILQKVQKVTKEFKIPIMYTRPEYFCSNKKLVEPCCEYPTLERINYRIHITSTKEHGVFKVDISTHESRKTKHFFMINNEIEWQ